MGADQRVFSIRIPLPRATPIILNGEELIIIHKSSVIGRQD